MEAAAAADEAVPGSASGPAASGRRSRGSKGSGRGKGGYAGGTPGDAAAAAAPVDVAEKLQAVQVAFCPDPRTLGAKFTATYDKAPALNFASLNAGDIRLMVGGATMNGQFGRDLYDHGWQEPKKYEQLHNRLLKVAKPGELVRATRAELSGDPNVTDAYIRAGQGRDGKTGVAIIDIFRPDVRPHSQKNVGMVYTVGPQREECGSDDEFIAAVRDMAHNVAAACRDYNALKADPRLEMLRVCLVSGGAFAGSVPKAEVANAICVGLVEGCEPGLSPVYEFAFDGDVFKTTWDALAASAAKGS